MMLSPDDERMVHLDENKSLVGHTRASQTTTQPLPHVHTMTGLLVGIVSVVKRNLCIIAFTPLSIT